MSFIENELIGFMSENYRSLNFRVAVGHGQNGQFYELFFV